MIESKYIKSVGFDIGTSTTHVVFSEILLKKDANSRTNKFEIADRKLLYTSEIYQTPLKENGASVDLAKLEIIFLEIYKKAGISINDVDTGAVIITGESARKENAEAVVSLMAEHSGKFVAATAGPHFESIISAKGSGAVDESKKNNLNAINIDIGGGTSNIAYIENGNILSTACMNIGGRLIVYEKTKKNYLITKAEPSIISAYNIVSSDVSLTVGTTLSNEQLENLINDLVNSLFESITISKSSDFSPLTQKLLMTQPLQIKQKSNLKLIISGGVAEYIYNNTNSDYGDIGFLLAETILKKLPLYPQFELCEPREKIRATVIGAGQYTLEVSGSTTFVTATDDIFPIRNYITVLPIFHTREFTPEIVAESIKSALLRLDINPESDNFILAFHNPVSPVYERITKFVKGIEKALTFLTSQKTKPLVLVFDTDIGNSVGNILRRETYIKNPIISLDEIFLKEGDFVDIGEPVIERKVFPVVVKSLIFND